MMLTAEIKLKLPSANDYIEACRRNRFQAAKLKEDTETAIMLFLRRLPKIEKPVKIEFVWTEDNRRRDLDNIAFGKKFILDALVKARKLKDDNRRCVTGFSDTFEYGKTAKVTLKIREEEEE